MNRRRWFVGRRLAVWFWGILALVLAADFCFNMRSEKPGTDRMEHSGALSAAQAEVAASASLEGGSLKAGSAGTVALTFDDGPHAVCTPRLLDGLKERGVLASFFLIGQNIDGNEEIVRRMQKEGHLIGNHSQSHMQLTAENARTACEQIAYTNQKIAAITGAEPAYIRPPYGSWNEELDSLVPMTVALWNLDPLDWKSQDASDIVRYVKNHVGNGSIILLHDVYETSVDAALRIVDDLMAAGYEFVTVDELLVE